MSILLPLRDDGGVDMGTVERVVGALYADPSMREVLAARPDPAERAYATLSDLKGLPPAEDVPFLVQEIGVLTVPAPAGRGPSGMRTGGPRPELNARQRGRPRKEGTRDRNDPLREATRPVY